MSKGALWAFENFDPPSGPGVGKRDGKPGSGLTIPAPVGRTHAVMGPEVVAA